MKGKAIGTVQLIRGGASVGELVPVTGLLAIDGQLAWLADHEDDVLERRYGAGLWIEPSAALQVLAQIGERCGNRSSISMMELSEVKGRLAASPDRRFTRGVAEITSVKVLSGSGETIAIDPDWDSERPVVEEL